MTQGQKKPVAEAVRVSLMNGRAEYLEQENQKANSRCVTVIITTKQSTCYSKKACGNDHHVVRYVNITPRFLCNPCASWRQNTHKLKLTLCKVNSLLSFRLHISTAMKFCYDSASLCRVVRAFLDSFSQSCTNIDKIVLSSFKLLTARAVNTLCQNSTFEIPCLQCVCFSLES